MSTKQVWLESTGNVALDSTVIERFSVDAIFQRKKQRDISKDLYTSVVHRIITEKNAKLYDSTGKLLGGYFEIGSSVIGQNQAMSLIGSVEWIVMNCTEAWTMIPCENLIAACDRSGTKLAVSVDSIDKLAGILFALQLGPSAVILPANIDLWQAYEKLMSDNNKQHQKQQSTSTTSTSTSTSASSIQQNELVIGTVTRIKNGGIGDRICLDLIQLLQEGEGLLIGSSSQLLTLIHAETKTGEFVPARPFRINAGPVHSYVVMADGSTKYLCEVEAGDAVKVVKVVKSSTSNDNNSIEQYYSLSERAVTVGRCKRESRPMLMVEFSTGDITSNNNIQQVGQVFLQQAETVRLIAPSYRNNNNRGESIDDTNNTNDISYDNDINGNNHNINIHSAHNNSIAVPVTELKVGYQIFILQNKLGTHVGKRISAKVSEK